LSHNPLSSLPSGLRNRSLPQMLLASLHALHLHSC